MLDTLYLHKSLDSPALQAGSFLNEVIEKYSDSISFAPGAPNPKQFDNLKIEYYIQLYINYIQNKYDLSKEDAKRTIYQYGPSQGIINKIIAEAIFNDNKITFPEESVLITTGAQEAMFIILRAILNSNQMQLAVVNPCYIGILGAAKLLDISITSINESSSGINLQELDHKCYQAKKLNHPIKLLYLSPDGSNPSGSLLDLESRLEVLNLANKHDFYIIEDSTYSFTIPSENKLPSLKQLDRGVDNE